MLLLLCPRTSPTPDGHAKDHSGGYKYVHAQNGNVIAAAAASHVADLVDTRTADAGLPSVYPVLFIWRMLTHCILLSIP